jgi:hypothetical protein
VPRPGRKRNIGGTNGARPDPDGPSRAQINVLIALAEGWRLRYDEEYRWSLFQPGRDRVFCRVRSFTVKEMTERGWLTDGTKRVGLGTRPAKELTPAGFRMGQSLIDAEQDERHLRERSRRTRLVLRRHDDDGDLQVPLRRAA